MPVKEEFMRYAREIPFVEGYLFQSFVFTKNPKEDFFKHAVFYAKDNATSFILIVEAGKKADFSGLKSQAIEGKDIYFGYTPSYRGLVEFDTEKMASWQEEGKVMTVLQVGDGKLAEIVFGVISSKPAFLDENFSTELTSLFGKADWIPELRGWTLLTLVFWKTDVPGEEGVHWIEHAQGNYLKGGDFINLEMRFGCIHEASLNGLRLEAELDDRKVGAFSFKQGKINEDFYMYYENEKNRFSVIAHDNGQNKEKHDEDVEDLLIAGANSLEGR